LKLGGLFGESTCWFFGPNYLVFVKDSFNYANQSVLKC
jgi:hypothetical protein